MHLIKELFQSEIDLRPGLPAKWRFQITHLPAGPSIGATAAFLLAARLLAQVVANRRAAGRKAEGSCQQEGCRQKCCG